MRFSWYSWTDSTKFIPDNRKHPAVTSMVGAFLLIPLPLFGERIYAAKGVVSGNETLFIFAAAHAVRRHCDQLHPSLRRRPSR
jgi:hypothetical protein